MAWGTTLHSAAPVDARAGPRTAQRLRALPFRPSRGRDVGLLDDTAAVSQADVRVRVADVKEQNHGVR